MKNTETKKIFNKYSETSITDEVADEIEQNLKQFFSLLIEWAKNEEPNKFEYKKEGGRNE